MTTKTYNACSRRVTSCDRQMISTRHPKVTRDPRSTPLHETRRSRRVTPCDITRDRHTAPHLRVTRVTSLFKEVTQGVTREEPTTTPTANPLAPTTDGATPGASTRPRQP